MEDNTIMSHIKTLQRARVQFVPEKYIMKLIHRAEDIVTEKKTLQLAVITPEIITYLIELIFEAINEDRKFKRTECLRIFVRILQHSRASLSLNKEQSACLFLLYQYTMSLGNEALRLSFTEALEGLGLEQGALEWLIQHAEESKHYTALLHSYPLANRQIAAWAERLWLSGDPQYRTARIAAILLQEEIKPEVLDPAELDTEMLMEAIYISKLSKRRKRELIIQYMDYTHYTSALEIASKLGIGKISKLLLKHYEELQQSASGHTDEEELEENEPHERDED